MTGRRGFAVVLTGMVVAAALVLLAAGRVWGAVTVEAQNHVRVHAQVKGHDVAGQLSASAIALLALALAVVAAHGVMRRLAGVLAAFLGVVIVAGAIAGQGRVDETMRHKVFAAQVATLHVPGTVWPWLAVLGGLVAVGCGVVTAAVGGRWSGLGRRYDAPGSPPAAAEDDASRWAALDRGEDPTT